MSPGWITFTQFFEGLSIPVTRLSWPFAPEDFPDLGLRKTTLGSRNYPAPAIPNPFVPTLRVYFLLDRYLVNYVILPEEAGNYIYVVGPFLYDTPVRARVHELARTLGLSARQEASMLRSMRSMRILRDRAVIENYIHAMQPQLYPSQTDPVAMEFFQELDPTPLPDFSADMVEDYKETFMEMEQRYAAEERMCTFIRSGDILRAQKELLILEQRGIPGRTGRILRDARNYLHVFHTLCRRSAYHGQVHPFYIDQLSGQFYRQIEGADSIDELRKIRSDMLSQYCLLVRQFSTEHVRPLIRDVLNHLSANFTEDISLESIAKEFHVNKAYLARIFKADTGFTVVEYINRRRVEHARYLMDTQNLSLGDVASACGFSSLNYFSRIFTRYEHTSPSAYRGSRRT